MGPFPTSAEGKQNRFLLVILDELSKWVELFPIKEATIKKTAEILEDQIFCRFGTPKRIITDNASQFTSNTMEELCKQWRIDHRYTSAYHPQANQSERTNRNLKKMLQAFITSHHQWDQHLQKFALALRTSINETTGVTPAVLNLGREIPLPFDRQMQTKDSEQTQEEIQEIPGKLKEIIKVVRENIVKAHEANKVAYDRNHREDLFKTGDYVLIANHSLSSKEDGIMQKLTPRWIGPFLLGKRISKVTFDILRIPQLTTIGKRHVSQLKPHVLRRGQLYHEICSPELPKTDEGKSSPNQAPVRELRNRPRPDYRTLAGLKV